jgi:hypothetical protein
MASAIGEGDHVTIEGIDTAYSEGNPWMLVGGEGDGAVHNDISPTRRLPGRGDNTLTLLVCLASEGPYTMRVFRRVQPFATRGRADVHAVEVAEHNDYKIQAGSWLLFPSKQQHMVVGGTHRTIVNFVFNRA